jgi:phosphate starvation-inducible PhoH-like protein
MVVTGDITQVDLPGGTRSGLRVVQGILDQVEDIAFCNLTNHDVVRNKLVGRIVAAYDRFEQTDKQADRPSDRPERNSGRHGDRSGDRDQRPTMGHRR